MGALSDLHIELKENTLTIKGEKQAKSEEKAGEVLYQGIAARSFERVFQLADFVQVRAPCLRMVSFMSISSGRFPRPKSRARSRSTAGRSRLSWKPKPRPNPRCLKHGEASRTLRGAFRLSSAKAVRRRNTHFAMDAFRYKKAPRFRGAFTTIQSEPDGLTRLFFRLFL